MSNLKSDTPMKDFYEKLESMSDEDIATFCREQESSMALEYLINKYRNFVRAKARSYFLIGADREDIIQEGIEIDFEK